MDLTKKEFDDQCRQQVNQEQNLEWETPILFNEDNIPDLSSNYLPSPIKEYVQAVSDNLRTPVGMGVFGALSILSIVLQGKFRVQASDTHKEPVNLYLMTVMEPGSKKTANMDMFREVLLRYEEEQFCLENMEQKQFIVNDATLESLIDCLVNNDKKIGILSDEGGIFKVWSGLYTKGITNIDVVLKGWDGGYIRIKRKDKDEGIRPFISIYTSIQHIVLEQLIKNREFKDSGFLDRFLFFSKEQSLLERIKPPVPINLKYIRDYENLILDLIDIKGEHILTLSKKAYQLWWKFKVNIEYRKEPGYDLCEILGWASKLAGQALRIAGLLHVVETKGKKTEIQKDTMQKSINILNILILHTLRALNLYTFYNNKKTKEAQIVWENIKKLNKNPFSQADITVQLKNKMKAEKIKRLMLELIERKLISSPFSTGGKTVSFYINPRVYKI